MKTRNSGKDEAAGPSRDSESPSPSTSNAAGTSSSPDRTRRLLESVIPARDPSNDNHSSEEELEDINSRMNDPSVSRGEGRSGLMSLNLRGDSAGDNGVSGLPEKRRWSVVSTTRTRRSCKMNRLSHSSESRSDPHSESSDEEIQGLLANIETNVDVRPPPSDDNRPSGSRSPPTKAQNEKEEKNERSTSSEAHASGQAHVQVAQHLLQRPCLDFEKMQQLKVRTVTAWRYNGDQGGELSLYCW